MTDPIGFSDLMLLGSLALEDSDGNSDVPAAVAGLERAGAQAVTPVQWNALAHAWFGIGQPERGLEWAERLRTARLDGETPPPLSDLTMLVQLYANCQAGEAARSIAERAEAFLEEDSEARPMIVNAWLDVGDLARARKLLEDDTTEDDGEAWFAQERALVWKRLGDMAKSAALFAEVERRLVAESREYDMIVADDLIAIAGEWKGRGDREAEERCLAAAHESLDHSDVGCYEMAACMDAWLAFGDRTRAREALDKAISYAPADTFDGGLRAAEACYDFGDDDSGLRLMATAEVLAADSDQLLALAHAWERLGEPGLQAKALEKAASHAANAQSWLWLEVSWPDADKRRHCREQAEACADNASDRAEIARAWAREGETERARAILLAAAAAAECARDLAVIGNAWIALGDRAAAEDLLTRAEAAATAAHDYVEIAKHHAELGDLAGALRCLELGQGVAKEPADWIALAEAWHLVAGDEARASECIDRTGIF
jgi:tetratricopeptide (TPR) repeat protein